ncbi:MAG: 6-phosphofructokinase [Erysipelotrichaceae bacterium]|nr:6-phosphofructokinase [Erysipelotrichaceae bacterium]
MVKCIGVLTSGGDAPGMNAAIRAVTRTCLNKGIKVYGVRLGYKGLHEGDFIEFDNHSTRNIINRGGTFLKSARFPEFKEESIRQEAIEQMKKVGMEALVVVGGDGSYQGALALTKMGINCIGLPGTIDNDIPDTDFTIGFDTALNTIVDALDKLRDTSSSHQRCTILEVMGRRCGDLAVYAGLSCGAEDIITSESGFDENELIEALKQSKATGKKHALVVITEHITDVHELAKRIEAATGFETRANVLGHMQRGGSPTARDRVLATRMGIKAVELLEEGKGGLCVSQRGTEIVGLPITEVLGHKREYDKGIYEDVLKIRY